MWGVAWPIVARRLNSIHPIDDAITMSRKGSEFAGLAVAMTTPFEAGRVDEGLLRAQVEFQIAAGTNCLVPVGTTGESPTLTHEEHERVISAVVPYF